MLSQQSKNLLILFFLALIWGSSYILMKMGLVSFAPIQVAALRIIISALVLLPFVGKVKWNVAPYILIVAFLGSGLPTFIYPLAITHIDSSLAGIINSLTPVFTVLFGVLLFKIKTRPIQILGLLISLIGAIVLIIYGNKEQSFSINNYALIAILAPIFYGLSSNVLKANLGDIPALRLTANTFVILLPFALLVLFNTNFIMLMQSDVKAYTSLAYIAILAVVGTAMALVIFNFLIKNTSAVYASSVTFLMPIVVLLWGVLDHELITWVHLLGLAMILIGVYVLNYVKN